MKEIIIKIDKHIAYCEKMAKKKPEKYTIAIELLKDIKEEIINKK